jgi:solute carrier family 25 protein 39/40
MSGFWDRSQPNSQVATTTFESESSTSQRGQGHDRIRDDVPVPGISPAMAVTGGDGVEFDITAGQKMVSAMSGSLLTSLLGKSIVIFTGLC